MEVNNVETRPSKKFCGEVTKVHTATVQGKGYTVRSFGIRNVTGWFRIGRLPIDIQEDDLVEFYAVGPVPIKNLALGLQYYVDYATLKVLDAAPRTAKAVSSIPETSTPAQTGVVSGPVESDELKQARARYLALSASSTQE